MGNNASPQLADLSLSKMEHNYCIEKNNKIFLENVLLANRYVDDLITLTNGENTFTEIAKNIYHESLTLEATQKTDVETNYLDLTVNTEPNISYKLFNKTDDYDFKVLRYTQYNSNIPQNYKHNII